MYHLGPPFFKSQRFLFPATHSLFGRSYSHAHRRAREHTPRPNRVRLCPPAGQIEKHDATRMISRSTNYRDPPYCHSIQYSIQQNCCSTLYPQRPTVFGFFCRFHQVRTYTPAVLQMWLLFRCHRCCATPAVSSRCTPACTTKLECLIHKHPKRRAIYSRRKPTSAFITHYCSDFQCSTHSSSGMLCFLPDIAWFEPADAAANALHAFAKNTTASTMPATSGTRAMGQPLIDMTAAEAL